MITQIFVIVFIGIFDFNHAFVLPCSINRRNQCNFSSFAIETFVDMQDLGLDVGTCNIPGVDWQRPGKVNQDWCFVDSQKGELAKNNVNDYFVVGVLDGHGKYGREVSSFAAKTLPREIWNQLKSCSLPAPIVEFEWEGIQNAAGFEDCSKYKSEFTKTQQALINAFHTVQYNAIHEKDVKAGRNGATCIVCHIDTGAGECNVAYVGDSRAICIHSEDESISVITDEQTVDLPSERKRIESREGSRIVGKNVFYGPIGIAMTRALGDAIMIRAGVVPTPMVGKLHFNKGDTLVLGTDGIWDVLSNERVREIALKNDNAQEAANEMAKIARERWLGDLPIMDEEKADDITVVVIRC